MWLEHLARQSGTVAPYALPYERDQFDFRPMLASVLADRRVGRAPCEIARAFHFAVANAVAAVADAYNADRIVVSGGVFQNALLVDTLVAMLGPRMWFNVKVPPNDGGLSLGQAAYALAELK